MASRTRYPGNDWRRARVSPHFRLGEFIRDQDHAPSRAVFEDVRRFAHSHLEPLRKRFGPATIISGHRTVAHNEQVGGAPHSFHVWERHPGVIAVDVIFKRGTAAQWYATASDKLHGGVGKYTTHLHVDNRPFQARW